MFDRSPTDNIRLLEAPVDQSSLLNLNIFVVTHSFPFEQAFLSKVPAVFD